MPDSINLNFFGKVVSLKTTGWLNEIMFPAKGWKQSTYNEIPVDKK
jgi:hypothetical protein